VSLKSRIMSMFGVLANHNSEEIDGDDLPEWFRRKVFQVCDGGRWTLRRRRETPRSETLMPSLRGSPWMRGARHKGFARAMVGIRSRTSLPTAGLPAFPFGLQDSSAQYLLSLPANHRVWVHEDQGLAPTLPNPRQRHPKYPVGAF
jgi:hypothetical protein